MPATLAAAKAAARAGAPVSTGVVAPPAVAIGAIGAPASSLASPPPPEEEPGLEEALVFAFLAAGAGGSVALSTSAFERGLLKGSFGPP